MSSERVDWVEIIEPKTKEHMYANLTTGECVWDPPEGVNVKRTDSSQWWELFDNNTHRFYYYNATTQTTVWRRPVGCDIIPLAKLQTLKQNTDPQQRREISTQTAQPGPQVTNKVNITNGILNIPGNAISPCSAVVKIASQTQTSPVHSRRSHHHHRCSDSRRGRGSADSGLVSSTATNAASAVALRRHTDSGRSSDSSISSAQQRRLQSQDSAMGCSVKASGTESVTSSSSSQVKKRCSGNATAVPLTETEKWPHQANLNHSGSGSFMSPRKDASDDSMHEKYFKSVESTPLSKRKQLKHGAISSGDSASPVSPASPTSPQPRIQLQHSSRSAFVSGVSPGAESHQSQQSHHSQQSHRGIAIPQAPVVTPHAQHSLDRHHHQPSYLDRNARERFSDRQLESSVASRGVWGAGAVGANAGGRANRPASLERRSGQTREITKRQHAEPEKLTLTKQHTTATPEIREPREKPPAIQHQISDTGVSGYGLKTLSLEPHLTKPNLDRHNKEMERERESKRPKEREGRSSRRRDKTYKKMVHSLESPEASGPAEDDDEDDGNISPLYSNWELRGLQHLLPLQNYILQQASMSEEHRVRDGRRREHRLDSDSWSGSAGSLSGHEPDNEDSDAAPDDDDDDFDGTYLTHRTPSATPATAIPASIPQVPPLSSLPHRTDLYDEQEYMNHGVSYYNTFVGYERENLHPAGIHRTQSAGGVSGGGLSTVVATPTAPALYSPVRTHPVPPSQQLSIPALVGVPAHEQDIEKFAQDNLNLKSKGIFRKKASVRDMLSWTGSSLTAPMLGVRWERSRRRAAIEMFRLVQVYMGDRKARPGMTLNSVARDVLHSAYDDDTLRDELYVQLCRQTTENPQRDSLLRGWELMAVCLAFVPPSATFQPALINYVNRHRDPTFADSMFTEICKWPIHVQVSHYAGVACRRLERIGHSGNRQPKKPNTDDIDQARIQIFRTSMFGNTLAEVMALQKDRFPNRQLPWIQTTLSNQILALQGLSTEGIFRVSADVDEVLTLKGRIDAWEEFGGVNGDSEGDAHAPASLLKLWYRELYEPLIPALLYADCVEAGSLDDASAALRCVRRMPRLNRRVLTYLIAFLQRFAAADVARTTKMDAANLATVFAPNCLRCPSRDPRVILENARREMAFVRCLILHMDTAGSLDVL